jgi:hypothetical protein
MLLALPASLVTLPYQHRLECIMHGQVLCVEVASAWDRAPRGLGTGCELPQRTRRLGTSSAHTVANAACRGSDPGPYQLPHVVCLS